MTRTTAHPAPTFDYVMFATGQLDPFVPPAAAGTAKPTTRRRAPYMYTCRLGAR